MFPTSFFRRLGNAFFWIALPLIAADSNAQEIERRKSQFRLSPTFAFNITANFESPTSLTFSNPGPATGGVDHFYDDGYVRVDSSGNANGETWFWGYQSASQVVNGDTIQMNSTHLTSSSTSESVENNPLYGVDLTYAYELGWNRNYVWGLEAGLGWLDLDFRNQGTTAGNAVRTTDSYTVVNPPPPSAPYQGTFTPSSANPVTLNDMPSRFTTALPGAATISGLQEVSASLYTLRGGLYIGVPVGERIIVQASGGFALGFVDSDFSYSQTSSVAGLAPASSQGKTSSTEFVGGWYADAMIIGNLGRGWSLFAGLQYASLGDYNQSVNGREVTVDLSSAFLLNVGAGFSF